MELTLKLVNGEIIEQSVDTVSCIVGRSSKCDVVVPHEGMSRQHCQIENVNGEIFVTDLGSTNGVLIDGQKIEPHKRTPYQTYLALSFGAVQNLQINLDPTDKVDESQTDNTSQHRANLTRTVTKMMQEPTKPGITEAAKLQAKNKKPEDRTKFIAMNIFAIFILLAAAYWYSQKESIDESYDVQIENIKGSNSSENFDRF